jgi:hypothetical protein
LNHSFLWVFNFFFNHKIRLYNRFVFAATYYNKTETLSLVKKEYITDLCMLTN